MQWPRSRAFKPCLIRFFFHPEQYFPLTNLSRFIQKHPDSFKFLPVNGANAFSICCCLLFCPFFPGTLSMQDEMTDLMDANNQIQETLGDVDEEELMGVWKPQFHLGNMTSIYSILFYGWCYNLGRIIYLALK